MGDKDHPVNLWLWRAGWQQEVEGKRPDMKDEYPAMHVDTSWRTSARTIST